jgi:hypothetical protein
VRHALGTILCTFFPWVDSHLHCYSHIITIDLLMGREASDRASKRTASYAELNGGNDDAGSDFENASVASAEDDSLSVDSDTAPRKKAKKESPAKKTSTKQTSKASAKSPAKAKTPATSKATAKTTSSAATAATAPSATTTSSSVTNILPSGVVDITQGGPVTTDSAAKKLLLQYLKQQNRPYSAIQMFDNLHKRIPKATLERVLTVLCGPGEGVLSKEYGKTRIYFPDQSLLGADQSQHSLETLADENEELKQEVSGLATREKELRGDLAKLKAEPEDNQLERCVHCHLETHFTPNTHK